MKTKRWLWLLAVGMILNIVLMQPRSDDILLYNRQTIIYMIGCIGSGALLSYLLNRSARSITIRVGTALLEGIFIGWIGGLITALIGILSLAAFIQWAMRTFR